MTHQRRLGFNIRALWWGGALILSLAIGTASAAAEAQSSQGDASKTVSNPAEPEGALSHRLKEQLVNLKNSPWAILPYRPNHILPLTYMSKPNEQPYEQATGQPVHLDNTEVKYQISFLVPVWSNLFGSKLSLFGGYTQVSVWQAYNSQSAPFRDTNYEPEAILMYPVNYKLLGFNVNYTTLSFTHQSNGRGLDALSRSWNRIIATVAMERGNLAVVIRPWWRIPESEADDNNPGIDRYAGYGDLRAAYKMGHQVIAGTLRNNLRTDGNKGSIQLDWSFPLPWETPLKGYFQYFNGYDETLIDYNQQHERIGVGVLLSDWL